MQLQYDAVKALAEQYGNAFYVLDTEQFQKNFQDLLSAFRHFYPNTHIAYSYKTNYIPRLCQIVHQLGGYAEVVSDMEYEITKRLGISAQMVVYNGPCKSIGSIVEIAQGGGNVNLDSMREIRAVRTWLKENPNQELALGLRCNFPVGDGVLSRFGLDAASEEFQQILSFFQSTPNVRLKGLHCHFASRKLETWSARVTGMLELLEKYDLADQLEYVDLGGGLYGNMAESLKSQFQDRIPSFEEYAQVTAAPFQQYYQNRAHSPRLLIEPGSALSGDVMYFVSKVLSIKQVQEKNIATLLGSIYNINPTLNKKNPPIEILSATQDGPVYTDLDFGGFTCIESDYLYRHYTGQLQEGDYVAFGNVGSYSVVLKPPFILPNFAVLECHGEQAPRVIKRAECFDDLFHTYCF